MELKKWFENKRININRDELIELDKYIMLQTEQHLVNSTKYLKLTNKDIDYIDSYRERLRKEHLLRSRKV